MNTAGEIADQIIKLLPNVKAGTLRVWGNWLGKAYDNVHRIVGCSSANDVLIMRFDEDELLRVWSPQGVQVAGDIFRIKSAAHVSWVWYSYGRPKTAENLYYNDFVFLNGRVQASTNEDWYKPSFKFDVALPAVEFL